jgi:hypothetical protein
MRLHSVVLKHKENFTFRLTEQRRQGLKVLLHSRRVVIYSWKPTLMTEVSVSFLSSSK